MNHYETLSRLSPQRILIIKPSAFGDVVQALPLIPALKQRYPQAEISWVIQSGLEGLVTGHPDVHEALIFRRNGTWSDWRQLLGQLWSQRFDLVIDLQGLLRTGVMTLATRSVLRVGLETAREGSRWTLSHCLPQTDRQVPAGERYLRVLDALGADRSSARLLISVSAEDESWAETQLAGIPRPVIAVHPGARWETKRWPVENYAELLQQAVNTWETGVLILGSPAEKPDADLLEARLRQISPSAVIRNLTGQSTLKQLTALLQRVDVAISNDSGPMQLASGLETPTLGIFTCTNALRSGPSGARHETVSTEVACGGSYQKKCPHVGEKHLACFRELTTNRVWSALVRLMEKNSIVPLKSDAA